AAALDGFPAEATGDVDQRVDAAERRLRGVDRLARSFRFGEIDAADRSNPARRRTRREIDYRNLRAALRGRLRDAASERAQPTRNNQLSASHHPGLTWPLPRTTYL